MEKKNKNKKIIIYISILTTILILVGATYAFFTYMKIGGNNKIVAGNIYLNFIEDNEIEIYNVFPETYEEAMANENNELTFEIRGKNTSTKDINYAIKINQGDDINGMNRFLDEHIRIYLECDGEKLVDGVRYNEWDDTIIALDTINAGQETEIVKTYLLKIWIDENILISDTEPNSSYTTEEYRNSFASIKVKVEGKTGELSKSLKDEIEEEYSEVLQPLKNISVEEQMPQLLKDEIEEEHENNLTQADAFGNRYISGTKAGITNNYVKFSDKLWRIVGINADGTIKLITESAMTYMPWDSTGNTDYATSEIHEWLNEEFLSNLNQEHLAESTFNYTGLSESFSVGEIKITQAKVGLLSAFDYIGVISADMSTGNIGLMTDNYLINGNDFWAINQMTGSQFAWSIMNDGTANPLSVITSNGIRPVINVLSTTKIYGGDGSSGNPYVIENESLTDAFGNRYISGTKAGITNNYVKFSDKLWRIVGINADGTIKLITESAMTYMPWDSTGNTDYATSEIHEWLNDEFLNTLDQDQIATGTINYTGLSSSFEVGEIKVLQAKVGLLTAFDYLGVISTDFSTGNAEFVEDNYLLNSEITTATNVTDSTGAWIFTTDANAITNRIIELPTGVRPVINLLSTARFIEGDGSKENPYVIESEVGKGDKYNYNNNFVSKLSNLTEADMNGTRYVNGLVEDNYVWYSGKLWRVVALNGDGTTKLVTQNNITSIAWDINNSNNYNNSQVRKWLNNDFLNTLYNRENLIVESQFDYGYGIADDKVGLLTLEEFYGTGGLSFSDVANTYLDNNSWWWLMTPYNSWYVWRVDYDGYANCNDADIADGVRPSVNLISDIRISGGEGTATNPYRLEGDIETGASSEYLNTRISGEYIKFNDTVYRIVGIETINNQKLTKITMADYSKNSNTISTSQQFGNSGVFSKTTGIGLYLNNWYGGLTNTYKNMIATDSDGVKWYQGDNTERDYTKAKLGTGISATIGLPYYGEMFSTQFGPGYEDSVVTWFMTRWNNSGSYVWNVDYDGDADYSYLAGSAYGVRPSMYLKSNVKIKDTNGDGDEGNGTANYPYEIAID